MEEKTLFNPTLEECFVDLDLLGTNPQHFVLKAGDIKAFPKHVAEMMEEKLANKILWDNPPTNKNREKKLKEILAVIRV